MEHSFGEKRKYDVILEKEDKEDNDETTKDVKKLKKDPSLQFVRFTFFRNLQKSHLFLL